MDRMLLTLVAAGTILAAALFWIAGAFNRSSRKRAKDREKILKAWEDRRARIKDWQLKNASRRVIGVYHHGEEASQAETQAETSPDQGADEQVFDADCGGGKPPRDLP